MQTFDYDLVTDSYSASGQVDAESEEAAKKIIQEQVAHPRKQSFGPVNSEQKVPQIKSLTFKLKKPA
jgi:hypothetical protein